MKTANFIFFCVLIVVYECVLAKRISELKCDELTSLNTNPRSLYPYLMELVSYKIGSHNCMAVLISENFVLISEHCVIDINDIKIRKYKFPGEKFSDPTPFFNVKRVFQRADLENQNSFILIELNETVPYRNTRSIYRPACLWTDTFQPLNLYAITHTSSNNSMVGPLLRTGCPWYSMGLYVGFLGVRFCFSSPDDSVPLSSTPIELRHRNETFIYGIISNIAKRNVDRYYHAAKIYSFLEWIEPIVWPQLMNRECGQRILKHKEMMTFAQPTYHGEYPWHVAIYRNYVYTCGGTILNRRTILTAAHCVLDNRGVVPPNRLIIAAGTNNLKDYPKEARNLLVESIIVHENYQSNYLVNDIAVLKLSYSIIFSDYIQSICITSMLDYNNFTMGSIAGWGRDEYNQPSNVLLQATLPIRDNFECRESNRDFFPQYLNDNNYCVGSENGTNICSGDSGSSMVIEFDSRWYIRGIVSLGVALTNSDRCDMTQLALLTDVPKMYSWIMKHVDDIEENSRNHESLTSSCVWN